MSSATLETRLHQQAEQMIAEGETTWQFCAYHRGELICDLMVGCLADNLFPIFSCGKGIAATAVHLLAQRGQLEYGDTVASHWPAFAAAGKESVTIRQILDHSAGLAMLPENAHAEDLCDWDAICNWLAACPPCHKPGDARHYHAITFGWLTGELVRRIDGRHMQTFIQDEICTPLGIDDLYFGIPDSALPLALDVYAAENDESLPNVPNENSPQDVEQNRIATRAIPPYICPLEDFINSTAARQACMPASNGFGTAKALARHYASLIGHGLDGVRLLNDATLDQACALHPVPDDTDNRFGLGYLLAGDEHQPGAIFGHGGYGGSGGYADREHHLAYGFTCQRMGGGGAEALVEIVRQELGC